MERNIIVAGILATAMLSGSAYAVTYTTESMSVTANVATSCSFSTPPGAMDFGSYDGTAINNVSSAFTVQCNESSYVVKINKGLNGGADPSDRKLLGANTGTTLAYQLYKDSGRTQLWGDGTGATTGQAGSGDQSYTVYGSLPASASPMSDTYSDTVTINVDSN